MASRVAVLLLAVVTLSGCALIGGPRDSALRRTPSYRAGYSDGCAAASSPAANPRNYQDSLDGQDRIYRRGWAGGYQACKPVNNGPLHTPLGTRPDIPG
jgi:hypothetical protein